MSNIEAMKKNWSISTHKLYRLCPRKFYLSKVLASPTSNDLDRWKAYYLSKLQTMPMLAGSVVHEMIGKWIASMQYGKQLSPGELIMQARKNFESRLSYSSEGKYKFESKTQASGTYCGLYEHEYEVAVTDEMLKKNLALIENGIRNFFQMEIDTKSGPAKLISVIGKAKKYSAESEDFTFQYKGWTVRPKIDLFLEFASSKRRMAIIIDWKVESAGASDNERQLLLYGYSVWKKWDQLYSAKPEDIIIFEINLTSCEAKRYEFGQEDIIATDDLIFESIREFNFINGNRKFQDFDTQEFGLTQNLNSCSYCSLKKLCVEKLQGREQEYASTVLKLF
jgi:hypothetical protein